jgi:prepilin peptidase CpaA
MKIMVADSAEMLAVLVLLLFAATYTDFKRHRITNVLTFGGALLGLALQSLFFGLDGFFPGAGGFLVGLAFFLPFYLLGGMGAGDVKLMAAMGTFLGPMATVIAAALTLVFGGVLALGVVWARRGLAPLLRRYGLMAKTVMLTGRISYVPPAAGEAATTRFPYAIAITLGTMAAVVWFGH